MNSEPGLPGSPSQHCHLEAVRRLVSCLNSQHCRCLTCKTGVINSMSTTDLRLKCTNTLKVLSIVAGTRRLFKQSHSSGRLTLAQDSPMLAFLSSIKFSNISYLLPQPGGKHLPARDTHTLHTACVYFLCHTHLRIHVYTYVYIGKSLSSLLS